MSIAPGMQTCRLLDADGLMVKANIPKRHTRGVKIDPNHPWVPQCEIVSRRLGAGFLLALLGDRGTGKTQMAVVVMMVGFKAQRTGLYVSAMDVFLDVRATYSNPDASERDALGRFLGPDMLVIDEIQQRGETDFEDRILAYLIDQRYGAMKDTIVIANLTPDALKDSLDPSIVDRLRETGGIIECTWPSFRGGADVSAAPKGR